MQSGKTSKQNRAKTPEKTVAATEPAPVDKAKRAVRTPRASAAKKPIEPVAAAAKSHRKAPKTIAEVQSQPVFIARTPSDEEVAKLAYFYWVERNYAHGFAEQDWHRAVTVLSQA